MGAKQVQFRRGSTEQHDGTDGTSGFAGAAGEITVDTGSDTDSTYTARVHDGTTTGGYKLAKQSTVDALNDLDSTDGTAVRSDSDNTNINGGIRYTNSSSEWKYNTVKEAITALGSGSGLFQALFNAYGTGTFDTPLNTIVAVGTETSPTSGKIQTNGSTTIDISGGGTSETWQVLAAKTTDGNHTELHGTPTIKYDELSSTNTTITHGLTNCVWIAIRTA